MEIMEKIKQFRNQARVYIFLLGRGVVVCERHRVHINVSNDTRVISVKFNISEHS